MPHCDGRTNAPPRPQELPSHSAPYCCDSRQQHVYRLAGFHGRDCKPESCSKSAVTESRRTTAGVS